MEKPTVTPAQLKLRIKIAVGLVALTVVVGAFAMYKQAGKIAKEQEQKESGKLLDLAKLKDNVSNTATDAKKALEQKAAEAKVKLKAEKDKKYSELVSKFKGDVTTADGKSFKQIKVVNRTPEGIEISSQEGTKFLKFQFLDAKTKSYFEYDPSEEAEYLQEKNGNAPDAKGIKKLPHTIGDPTQK